MSFPTTRGLSLIDVIVGVGLTMLVFVGLFGAFRLSVELISLNKERSGAVALANERVEYVRSLPYDDVATVGGIPAGDIPQTETVVLNNIDYTRRTLIQYVDAPQDGEGAADETGITADYKSVKVEVSWDHRGRTESFSLVTTVVPRGIENLTGGGTLRVNVIDASGVPVTGASVRVVNDSTSPLIDTTAYTNVSGEVIFPGAPAASEYEITVSKSGYSTAGTYDATAGNPNPNPAHLTILTGNTTSATFAIDLLAQKTVYTFEPVEEEVFEDSFADTSNLAVAASTTASGGSLALTQTAGLYDAAGSAESNTISPALLYGWDALSFNYVAPVGTAITLRVLYDAGSSFAPVPDAALPGNSTGFTASPIDLSTLSTEAYPSLRLAAELSTTDQLATPSLNDWTLSYRVGPTPIPGVAFSMEGTKAIGTDSDGNPVKKVSIVTTTDADAEAAIDSLEWDSYTITVNGATEGYMIAESCDPQPRTIAPGETATTTLFLAPHTAHALRVVVRDENNDPLPGASVRLTNSGYDTTQESGDCGGTLFSGVSEGSDYTLEVSASGYATFLLTPLQISGYTTIDVPLTL